jgi:very-short-patch-repair endonuclease
VVELDGDVHQDKQEYDEHRDVVLSSRGLLVLRFKNTDVESNVEQVLAKIEAGCRRHLTP